jgi:hypothetical protein
VFTVEKMRSFGASLHYDVILKQTVFLLKQAGEQIQQRYTDGGVLS